MRCQPPSSTLVVLTAAAICLLVMEVKISSQSVSSSAHDPGARGGAPAAGHPLPGLTPQELEYFNAALGDFDEAEEVDEGMGARMNLDGCGGWHAQPAIDG